MYNNSREQTGAHLEDIQLIDVLQLVRPEHLLAALQRTVFQSACGAPSDVLEQTFRCRTCSQETSIEHAMVTACAVNSAAAHRGQINAVHTQQLQLRLHLPAERLPAGAVRHRHRHFPAHAAWRPSRLSSGGDRHLQQAKTSRRHDRMTVQSGEMLSLLLLTCEALRPLPRRTPVSRPPARRQPFFLYGCSGAPTCTQVSLITGCASMHGPAQLTMSAWEMPRPDISHPAAGLLECPAAGTDPRPSFQ